MDSSGFLSPKANAFSIAHLIDRAQLADLAFLRQNPNYHWNSQVLLREMEGKSPRTQRCDSNLYRARHQSLNPDSVPCGFPENSLPSVLVICFSERLMNVGTGKRTPLRGIDKQRLMPEDSDEESDTGTSPASSPPPVQSSCSQAAVSRPLCSGLINALVNLEMKSLWEEFHSLGTEMIVTKAGRYFENHALI